MNMRIENGADRSTARQTPMRGSARAHLTLCTPAGSVSLEGMFRHMPGASDAESAASSLSMIVDGLCLIAAPGCTGGDLVITYRPLPSFAHGPAFELSATLDGVAQVHLAQAIRVETAASPMRRWRVMRLHEYIGDAWVRVRNQQFDGARVTARISRMGRYRFE